VSSYKKGFYGRIEAVQSRASTLAGYFQNTGRGDYLAQDLARYVDATPEAVHAAARRFLDINHVVRLDILPGKKDSGSPPPAATPTAATPTAAAPTAATPTTAAPKAGGRP
jgi:hypothetical protein